MNSPIQPKQSVVCPRERPTRRKIHRDTFISVGVLFASARLLAAAMSSILLLGILAPGVSSGTITSFDVPGGEGATYPAAINPAGTIMGWYADGFAFHGFLRAHDGTFTTFDIPAGAIPLPDMGINPAGAITGSYFDVNFLEHSFVRSPDGTITTFDVPGSGYGQVFAINPAGAITGFYYDVDGGEHGFLRSPGGTITTFDVPGAADFTEPSDINPLGAITGFYVVIVAADGFLPPASLSMPSVALPHCARSDVGCGVATSALLMSSVS